MWASIQSLLDQQRRLPPIVPIAGAAPLAFAQERLWYLHELDVLNTAYNMTRTRRFIGALRVPALGRALRMLGERQRALLTWLVRDGRSAKQAEIPVDSLELRVLDLEGTPPALREERAARVARRLASRSPLLTRRLFETVLIRFASDDHVLIVATHHILFDEWSFALFWYELGELYSSCILERTPTLPALAVTFRDYAAWQRECAHADAYRDQLEFWEGELQGLAPTVLAVESERSPDAASPAGRIVIRLSTSMPGIMTAAASAGATPFEVFVAVLSIVLSRHTGTPDVAVGSIWSCRHRSELESLIGLFVNTLVIRTTIAPNARFLELLATTRAAIERARANQDVPFNLVAERLPRTRAMGPNPFFSVALVVPNVPEFVEYFYDVSYIAPLRLFQGPNTDAKFDLLVTVRRELDSCELELEFDAGTLSAPVVGALGATFARVLRTVLCNPQVALSDIGQTAPGELLAASERGAAAVSHEHSIPVKIEHRVTPRKSSREVDFKGSRVSLDELEAVLSHLPGVGSTAIVVHPNGGALIYFLVASVRVSVWALRKQLAQRVPSNVLPGRMIVLPELPKTDAGGVDYAALETLIMEGPTLEGATPPMPSAEFQTRLAHIWCAVLGTSSVHPEDRFFDLGGNSLLALEVVHQARQAGIDLQLRDLIFETLVGASSRCRWSRVRGE